VEGTHAGAEEESEEEEAAEAMCDELTASPILRPPVWLRGEEEENMGVKLSPGRGEGKVFLRFGFISHYPAPICLVIN